MLSEDVSVRVRQKRLNLGCGNHTPDHWINVDYSIGARCAKLPFFSPINRRLRLFNIDWRNDITVHDLRRRFPWKDNEIDAIYTSHTLQHFRRADAQEFVRECYRVLKPGGILRVIVPDLRRLVDAYLAGEVRADRFIDELLVHHYSDRSGVLAKLAPIVQYPCRCTYDAETLLELLTGNGFSGAQRDPFDSDLCGIKDIELPGRVADALIVEAVKT